MLGAVSLPLALMDADLKDRRGVYFSQERLSQRLLASEQP